MKNIFPKFYLFALIMTFFALNSKAQNWEWSTQAIGNYNSTVNGITTDSDGNVLTTGYFQDSLSIGGSLLIGDYGDVDPFMAKHDANGQFLWARHFDGHSGIDFGSKMVTNSANEIYLMGTGSWIMDFGNQTDTLREIILAKFDENGNVLWSKRPKGAIYYLSVNDIVLDDQENLLVTGGFTNTIIMDEDSITANGGTDIFLQKIGADGQTQWLKNYGSAGSDRGLALELDDQENIYLGGTFEDSITINGQQVYGVDEEDPFLMKLDNTGDPVWFRHGGSTADDGISSVKVDDGGNIFLQGHFRDTRAYFENDTLTSGTNLSETHMLIKYDANGDYQWGKTARGAFSTNKGLALFPDDQGGCVAAGTIDYEVSFEGDTSLSAGRDNNISTFFAHYNDTGYVTEAFLIPAFNGNGVHKANDRYYLGGNHFDSILLGTTVYGEFNNRVPVFGVFTHSFGGNGSTSISELHSDVSVKMFPNPTTGKVNLEFPADFEWSEQPIRIYNQLGMEVSDMVFISETKTERSLGLDLSPLSTGLYFIQITGNESIRTQKVLKQ